MSTAQLTSGQEKAISEILTSIEKKEDHVLMGYAGTGKTFLCQQLVERLSGNVALCSPTNKAAQVLSAATNLSAQTIYKLLCLRLDKGKLYSYNEPELWQYKAIIVDECSMLNAFSFQLLKQHAHNTPIIYIGDPAQLPPVKERESKSFGVRNRSLLTKIVRQAEGNPIIEYSTALRQGGFNLKTIPFDSKNLLRMNPENVIHKALKNYETGGVLLAWTNKTCDYINYNVHDLIYNDKSDFSPGESIILQEPLVDFQKAGVILANNSDTLVIESVKPSSLSEDTLLHGKIEFPTWEITTTEGFKLNTIRRDYQAKFKFFTKNLMDGGEELRYYWWKERVTEIKHCYAMTCHKSQGSTFKRVMIAILDIMANSDVDSRNKCIYVAVTRASEKVAFLM